MPIAFPLIPRGRPATWAKNLAFNPLAFQVNPNLTSPNFKFDINTLGEGGVGKIYPMANPAALKVSIGKRFAMDNLDQFAPNDAKLVKRKEGYLNTLFTGVSRDSTGGALGSCQVLLFDTRTKAFVAETTSDGSGNWSISLGATAGPFFLVEYKAGGTPVAGTSLNTLAPTPV